jgi:hypothetical protein
MASESRPVSPVGFFIHSLFVAAKGPMFRTAPLFLAILPTIAHAMLRIDCHTTYGGETHVHVARPVDSPYRVAPVNIGSYFRFRVVFQDRPADLASVKIYAYADRDEGPVLIQQATFPWPLPSGRRRNAYGFTGLQHVYEPVRDGELAYWCEQVKEGGR